jgi:hypothetical protein
MGLVECPSILAQFSRQRRVVEQPVEHRLELAAADVEQAAVAAQALAGEDVAAAVGQHRDAERPGLDHHHRQALEIRRHHQRLGAREHVVLVLVADVAEVTDAWVHRHWQHRRADQHQVERAIGPVAYWRKYSNSSAHPLFTSMRPT